MIKRILALAVSAVMLACCSGCVVVNFAAGAAEIVTGEGSVKAVEYEAKDYTIVRIRFSSEFELYYTDEPSDKLVVELQENLAEHIDVSVKDGVLNIKSDKQFMTDSDKIPKLRISAASLEEISAWGSMSIKQSDAIKADSFLLNVSGAVNGKLPLEVNTLNVDISGACDITLSGRADEADYEMAGASAINALELTARKSSVSMSGACEISVDSSDTLDINISGSGKVDYKGDPQITKNFAGAVSINRID